MGRVEGHEENDGQGKGDETGRQADDEQKAPDALHPSNEIRMKKGGGDMERLEKGRCLVDVSEFLQAKEKKLMAPGEAHVEEKKAL